MPESIDILKRALDLSARSDRQSTVTCTGFLTPAQQHILVKNKVPGMYLTGGGAECERKIAFFLPFYIAQEEFDPSEYICAVKAVARFATPTHRDYLGALLAQGIARESIGDIYIFGETAYFYVLPSVSGAILASLNKIGRNGVRLEAIPIGEVEHPEIKYKEETFTVQSFRLDSILAGAFRMSRSEAARIIAEGLVSLNYDVCQKPDAQTEPGDTVSARGFGKFEISEDTGVSRKGRSFVTAKIRI